DGTRALERVVQVGRESSAAAVERVAARIVAALVPSEGVVAAPHLRRRLAPSGPRRRVAAAESEQPSNPGEGPLGNGEARAYALKKRLEVRGVAPLVAPEQVVGEAQVERRQQVAEQVVSDAAGYPAAAPLLLRLLEVIDERTRADAEQPELRRLTGLCRQRCAVRRR